MQINPDLPSFSPVESKEPVVPMPRNSGSAIQKAHADFRVSVIIPLYNHEKYIEAAIESVFSQTVLPAEIIVIDDGSVDGSAAIVRRLCKDHPEIIFWSWPNQGAHHTLNAGILRATGDFVAILNSDDCYHPERLAACLAIVQSDPSIDIVATGTSFFDGQGNDMENPWYENALTLYKQEGILSLGLFHENFIVTTSNLFIRRSVFEWVGYFSPLRYTHDLEFCLRVILGKRHIHFLDRSLLFYRLHKANTILEDKAKIDVERAAIFAFFLHRQELPAGSDEGLRSWIEGYVEVLGQKDLLEMVENLLTILDESRHRRDGGVSDSLHAEFLNLLSRLGAGWVAHNAGDTLLNQFVTARNAYLQRKESAGGNPKFISKLKKDIQWLTEQRDAWKNAFTQELEEMRIGNSWLTEQRDAWKNAFTQELEEMRIGNSWLTEQRDAWKKAAEIQEDHSKGLTQELEEMRIGNSCLTEQRDAWEREAKTSGAEIAKCHATLQGLQRSRIFNLLIRLKLLKIEYFPPSPTTAD